MFTPQSMKKKDVTPNNKQNGAVKKFFIGMLGGIVGGLFTVGIFFLVTNSSISNGSSNTTQNDTKVSNVSYNVDSDTTKAVEKVQDAVVSVINLQTKQESSFSGMFGTANEADTDSEESAEAASEGSGVIYKKENGKAYIVTNNHVVDGADSLEVVLADGTKLSAKLVGKDTYSDLAVLEVDGSKIEKVAEFGDSDKLKVGEPVIAIGSPLGSEFASSVTQGIVSATNRNITNKTDDNQTININAIQTDAAINPGNSGGALVNAAGQVIGINSAKIAESTVEGMGFAIPSNDVVSIINQLEKNGKVVRPALGIGTYDLTSVSSEQQKSILKVPTDVKSGVIVMSVSPATPADKANLQKYDVITEIDGTEIKSTTDLQSVLYGKKVGDKIKITYYHEEEKKTAEVELTIDSDSLNKSE